MLDVRTVGLAPDLVPYTDAWSLQREVHRHVVSGASPNTLLLLEHESVFTAGARTTPDERPVDGTPVIDVDRGGKITWHGPGQLVGYPIVRLEDPVDVLAHVRRMEQILLDVLSDLGASCHRVTGRSGVWARGEVSDNKIAAIGVRVQQGVTMHGFALNCNNSLAPFEQITPCGIRDAGVSTITDITGSEVSPADVADAVAAAFQSAFGVQVAA